MKKGNMSEHPLMEESSGIPLFYPHIAGSALAEVEAVLSSRWIGQGPKSAEFEQRIEHLFCPDMSAVAVNSGTSALHLAYILAGIGEGDEVLSPVFTCTATNIPLLYLKAQPVFVDIEIDTMNISLDDMRRKITPRTKAVVVVDYGGSPCDYEGIRNFCDEHGLTLISDAAHSLGTKVNGKNISHYCDFIVFSFQAIKTVTTADGGLLGIKDKSLVEKAKRIRWFGIDRESKQQGIWQNDIFEIGYKYQLSDLCAAIGLANLNEYPAIITKRREILDRYYKEISNPNICLMSSQRYTSSWIKEIGAWLMTIRCKHRTELMDFLRREGIESAQVHYRNDRYSIFSDYTNSCPNMDEVEDEYLVIPSHTRLKETDVSRIVKALNSFEHE